MAVAAAALLAGGCAVLAGLPEYTLGAGDAGAPDTGDARTDGGANLDGSTSDAADAACPDGCPAGYACVSGGCGNEVVQISAGDSHACARLRGGEVWCWGDNAYGELGLTPVFDDGGTSSSCGMLDCRPTAVKVTLPLSATWVSAGSGYTCAADVGGDVFCWGLNNASQLGHASGVGDVVCRDPGYTSCDPHPSQVLFSGGHEFVTAVSAGHGFACALTAETTVYCWGSNEFVTLGTGAEALGSAVPLPIVNLDGGVTEVSASQLSACAVRGVDGTVWCWGSNAVGQLGHDPANDPLCAVGGLDGSACALPQPVSDSQGKVIDNAATVNVGDFFACYLTSTDRTIWCWGGNGAGNLGTGTVIDETPHPYPLAQMTGPQQGVSGSANVVCANTLDGGVACWGAATDLALGEAGAALAEPCQGIPCVASPVPIIGLSDVVSVAAGGVTGVALRSDGSVWAWGSNVSGMLGHPPGPDAGDVQCETYGSTYCNGTPSPVLGLP